MLYLLGKYVQDEVYYITYAVVVRFSTYFNIVLTSSTLIQIHEAHLL